MPACPACHRLNPASARFCFHDGVALPGSLSDRPVPAGSRPFLAPFVFPSGRACRNFDELLRACEDEWTEAGELLADGAFAGFLNGLGRADLALAARQASNESDRDHALDWFLARLPGERVPPRLAVEPREFNIGRLAPTHAAALAVEVSNEGGGLLCGTARSEAAWLALGDAPGAPSKLFRCRDTATLAVQIHASAMPAGTPQEGKLVLDAGNTSIVVLIRASRPVVSFAEGVLAGAASPRQLAEKARDQPREAAALFESGAVARWYRRNGWTYPVQGPAATGTAAVQQYFEALGLTKPPKVVMPRTRADVSGPPGGVAEVSLSVETAENRPVYVRAASDTDWLEVGKIRHQGASAQVQFLIPRIPARPGQEFVGRAMVIGNGNQRFEVEVRLKVEATSGSTRLPPPVRRVVEVESAPAYSVKEVPAVPVPVAREVPVAAAPAPPSSQPAPEPAAASLTSEQANLALPNAEAVELPPQPWSPLAHLVAPVFVLLALLGTVVHDLLLPRGDAASSDAPELLDPTPVVVLDFNDRDEAGEERYPPRTMTFGISVLDASGARRVTSLVYDNLGRTNNVCVRIDGTESLVGHPDLVALAPGQGAVVRNGVGSWVEMKAPLGKDARGRERDRARSVWRITGPTEKRVEIEVVQTAEVVPGEQSGRLDTVLVRFGLHNKGNHTHEVGLRFLLDTFIGSNDGVPFTIPGQAGLCSTRRSFDRPADVPDYIQALENEDLQRPGTVAHLQFRVAGALEPPSRVTLGGWPNVTLRKLGFPRANSGLTFWDVPLTDIRELVNRRGQLFRPNPEPEPDSAVTLYWEPKALAAGARREVGFSYGLGEFASAESAGRLLLTVGGRTVRDGEFTLTALRANPVAGERLVLRVPAGDHVRLLSPAEQPVPPVEAGAARPISTVTWRLKGLKTGRVPLRVESSAGFGQAQQIRIQPPRTGILD